LVLGLLKFGFELLDNFRLFRFDKVDVFDFESVLLFLGLSFIRLCNLLFDFVFQFYLLGIVRNRHRGKLFQQQDVVCFDELL
jgi:hypothetical protein